MTQRNVNVEVAKNGMESTANLIRRFTKRMQGAGVLPRVRGLRYHSRIKSRNVNRRKRLVSLDRKEKYDELVKLGKIQETFGGRRR